MHDIVYRRSCSTRTETNGPFTMWMFPVTLMQCVWHYECLHHGGAIRHMQIHWQCWLWLVSMKHQTPSYCLYHPLNDRNLCHNGSFNAELAGVITVSGILYKEDCVVVLGVQRDYPAFGQIKNIFVVNTNQVYFQVNKLDTMKFNTHGHMHTVKSSASLQVLMLIQFTVFAHL